MRNKLISFILIILSFIILSSCSSVKEFELIGLSTSLDLAGEIDPNKKALINSFGYNTIYQAKRNEEFKAYIDFKLSNDEKINYVMVNDKMVRDFEIEGSRLVLSFNTSGDNLFLYFNITEINYGKKMAAKATEIYDRFAVDILGDIKDSGYIYNINTDYTSVEFDFKVKDRLYWPEYENLYLLSNGRIEGIVNIYGAVSHASFNSLRYDTEYTYISLASYNANDGNSMQLHTSLYGTIRTKAGYKALAIAAPNKITYIGNSITKTVPGFGLAASKAENDYAHLLTNELKKYNPNVEMDTFGLSDLENINLIDSKLNELDKLDPNTDLLFIDLGDNFDYYAKNVNLLVNKILAKVKSICSNAKIYWVGGWYWSPYKTNALVPILNDNDIEFISIEEANIPSNQAKLGDFIYIENNITYSVKGEFVDYKNGKLYFKVNNNDLSVICQSYHIDGELIYINSNIYIVSDLGSASHPNDLGMIAIKDIILNKLSIRR